MAAARIARPKKPEDHHAQDGDGAYGDDPFAVDGHGLGAGRAVVHGDDLGVDDGEGGGFAAGCEAGFAVVLGGGGEGDEGGRED